MSTDRQELPLCTGKRWGYGVSRHTDHNGKSLVYCPWCEAFLGCTLCLPIGAKICQRCNRDTNGERMMSRELAREAIKLVRMVQEGHLEPKEATQLFNEAARMSRADLFERKEEVFHG